MDVSHMILIGSTNYIFGAWMKFTGKFTTSIQNISLSTLIAKDSKMHSFL